MASGDGLVVAGLRAGWRAALTQGKPTGEPILVEGMNVSASRTSTCGLDLE